MASHHVIFGLFELGSFLLELIGALTGVELEGKRKPIARQRKKFRRA